MVKKIIKEQPKTKVYMAIGLGLILFSMIVGSYIFGEKMGIKNTVKGVEALAGACNEFDNYLIIWLNESGDGNIGCMGNLSSPRVVNDAVYQYYDSSNVVN